MYKFFDYSIQIIVSSLVLLIGILLIFKTQYILLKLIKILHISKGSIQYEYAINNRNFLQYKFTGIIFIIYGVITIYFFVSKVILK